MSDSVTPGRRYNEREVALILRRAAELQEGGSEGRSLLSLQEVRHIAEEVGIDPACVTSAALSLERDPMAGRLSILGAPTTFVTSFVLDRALSDEEVGDLIDRLRGALGVQGQSSQTLDTIEWQAGDSTGNYFLSASRRGGSTRLRLVTQRIEQATAVGVTTGTVGILGTIFAAVALDPSSVPMFFAVMGGGAVASLGAIRLVWTGMARRWNARLRDLGAALHASAQDAPISPEPPAEPAPPKPSALVEPPPS